MNLCFKLGDLILCCLLILQNKVHRLKACSLCYVFRQLDYFVEICTYIPFHSSVLEKC